MSATPPVTNGSHNADITSKSQPISVRVDRRGRPGAKPRVPVYLVRIDGSFANGCRHGTQNTLIGIEVDAMSILSPEQRRQIEQEGVIPIDDGAFVVLRADLYDRIRSLIEGEDLTIDEQRR